MPNVNIFAIGDSHLEATDTGIIDNLRTFLGSPPGLTIDFRGISGLPVQQYGRFENRAYMGRDTILEKSATADQNYIFVGFGTNDIIGGEAYQTLEDSYKAICQRYFGQPKMTGVITCNTLQMFSAGDYRNGWAQATNNSYLNAHYTTWSHRIIKAWDLMGAPPSTYFNSGDNVHLTETGKKIMARFFAAQVASFGYLELEPMYLKFDQDASVLANNQANFDTVHALIKTKLGIPSGVTTAYDTYHDSGNFTYMCVGSNFIRAMCEDSSFLTSLKAVIPDPAGKLVDGIGD